MTAASSPVSRSASRGRHLVVGGGLVGLGTAWALTRRGVPVTVCEKESGWATHQSGRNSGVVHSGLYYPPGSLKATMAVTAARELAGWCEEHDVPFRRTGKVILASRSDELPRMRALLERGVANGVPVRELPLGELAEREPHVRGLGALWVDSTAVVDFPAMAQRLVALLTGAGAEMLTGTTVLGLHEEAHGIRAETTLGDLRAERVVGCGGLWSDRLDGAGERAGLRIVPFRGEYWELVPERRDLVRGLVYPVPDPALPFLGVHLTRDIHDDVHVGPNAVPALAREGYSWSTVSARDVSDTLRWPGSWHVARRHGSYAAGEVSRSLVPRMMLRAVRGMLPDIGPGDLRRAGAGVRAQAVRRDGTLCDDFVLERHGRVLHVLNAPSPAATASLLIGERIADELLADVS